MSVSTAQLSIKAPANSRSRVILASLIGTTIEFYDFYVYATAAVLVFPHLFFPPGNETTALLSSFAIFGAAMVARPLGAIFFGHLGGLLTPIQVFDALGIGHGFKQGVAIVVGGAAGLMCLVGITLLTHRRLADPRIRATSSFSDTAILLILFAQLLLGLLTIPVSLGHMDGHEMVKFMTWAQGVLTLQADAWQQVKDANIIFKLHLTLGMTVFLLFPFTRLVHVWSAPIWYLGRRGYQVVRTRRNLTPAE